MSSNHRIALTVALIALLWSTSAAAMSVEEVPNPRDRNEWVSDTVDVIPSAIESQINDRLDTLEHDLGVEVAVVTVQQVDTPTPKDFATELFNHWGIGKASKDNGLLVLLVLGDRRLEMETGYGTEAVLTDGWLKRMQQEKMVPKLKADKYGEGLRAGVAAADKRLRTYPEGIGDGASSFEAPETHGTHGGGHEEEGRGALFWFIVIALGGGAATGGGMWYKRHREGICPECDIEMNLLPESEEDEQLAAAQELEENIGAVEYRVYNCPECDHDKVVRDVAWFSGFDRCPRCRHRTLATESRTIEHATEYSTGRKRITEECANCDYYDTFTRTIPRKTTSSSSSSGGGSSGGGGGGSFGGGSSGGGGAGSSF